MNKNTKGFAHIFVLIILALLITGGIGYSVYKTSKKTNTVQENSREIPSELNQNNQEVINASPNPLPTSKIITTPKPTPKSTSTPTPSNSSNSSCTYDLISATGAVKVNIQAQAGILIGDQIVELQAKSGCNVLVNKSADKDTRIARQGSPTVDFSQVPPGSYSLRARYKDQWTSYQTVAVSSGQQTISTITVSGDTPTNTPTPTPKPKPTCMDPIIYPSSTGTAPFQATLQPQGNAGEAGGIQGYEWDFTGDGTWDTSASPNAQIYTFQSPGTYTVKMRVLATNGEYSNVCQTTVTVN